MKTIKKSRHDSVLVSQFVCSNENLPPTPTRWWWWWWWCVCVCVYVCVCGGDTCSLVPMKKSAFSLVPQNQNLDFLCSLLPKIAFVPLFSSVVDFYSVVPLKYMALFPSSLKPLEGPQYWVKRRCYVLYPRLDKNSVF